MFTNLLQVVALVVTSLGGGGFIVFSLSSWLGKVWADRLMQRERAAHEIELEAVRARTSREVEQARASLQGELEAFKAELAQSSDLASRRLVERVALYKDSIAPLLDLYARFHVNPSEVDGGSWQDFEHKRLMVAATLGMFAPNVVFECYNQTVEYLQDCRDGLTNFEFAEFRRLGFAFLNAIRSDLGSMLIHLLTVEPDKRKPPVLQRQAFESVIDASNFTAS